VFPWKFAQVINGEDLNWQCFQGCLMRFTHMIQLANKWRLLTLAALSVSALASAQTSTIQDPMPGPLPVNHPEAKVDPRLLLSPPIDPGRVNIGPGTAADARGISYDVATGQVRMDNPSTNFSGPTVSEPFAGFTGGAWLGGDNGRGIQSVIGADTRVKITNVTVYPWRTVCKLYMRFPNGKNYIGSGILVANKYILTAGHCIHSRADGGWATRVEVVPGQRGSYRPYGSALATRLRSYTGWTSSSNTNFDLALVTLNRTIGNSTGWLGYAAYSTINGLNAQTAGYPGDRDGGVNMYYTYGPITSSNAWKGFYKFDTAGGQSGSGVWRITGSGSNLKRYVFVIHTTGYTTYNGGTRITTDRFNNIRSWIASGT
jgi:V8-like Glu-specific endopeptidase